MSKETPEEVVGEPGEGISTVVEAQEAPGQ